MLGVVCIKRILLSLSLVVILLFLYPSSAPIIGAVKESEYSTTNSTSPNTVTTMPTSAVITTLTSPTVCQSTTATQTTATTTTICKTTSKNVNATHKATTCRRKISLTGEYRTPNLCPYSSQENDILQQILAGMRNKNEDTILLKDWVSSSSYYRIASFFYIYYGDERAINEVFDIVTSYEQNQFKETQIRIRHQDIAALQDELNDLHLRIDNMLSNVYEGTEEEILKQISKIIMQHTVYTDGCGDLKSIVVNGKGTCNSYALLFYKMANRAGIACDVCIGKASNGEYHAWNRVTLKDGSYRYYDITFQDTNGSNGKYLHMKQSPHGSFVINDYTECWNMI